MLTADSISIDGDAIVALTQRLVRLRTINPPGDYGEIAPVVCGEMQRLGLETVVMEGQPGKPNVFGLLRSPRADAPTLLLSGHMDVVGPGELSEWRHDPFGAEIIEGALWGRGSVDMKGAIAAQLAAIGAVKTAARPVPAHIMVGATVDDEIAGNLGQKYVLQQGLATVGWPVPDFHVLGEATSLHITGTFKGRLWARVKFRGKTAHGGAPQEGVNAIEMMMAFLSALKAHRDVADPIHGPDTVNLGRLQGGTRVNAVADECEALVDYRFSGFSGAEAQRTMRQIANDLARRHHFTVVELSVFELRDPVRIAADSPYLAVAAAAVERATGRPPEFRGALSAGDAYHSLQRGIPAVWIGPGDVRMLHAPNEHMPVAELLRAARVYAALILDFAQQH